MRPCLSRELPVVYGSCGEEFFSVGATSKLNSIQTPTILMQAALFKHRGLHTQNEVKVGGGFIGEGFSGS